MGTNQGAAASVSVGLSAATSAVRVSRCLALAVAVGALATSLRAQSIDPNFNPGAVGIAYALAQQADGRILVGGNFTTLAGQARNRIGRVNLDGSADTSITSASGAIGSVVYAVAEQPDGKILVAGNFTNLAGQARNHIGRLNADGTLDTGFTCVALGNAINALAVQADGKIVAGGSFTNMAGQARSNLARLNADGTLDAGFTNAVSGIVFCLAAQPDGKILVGGTFSVLGGKQRSRLARLNTDGSLDTGFTNGANTTVYALQLQADGKILVGGMFTSLAGQARNRLGRLNADSTLDASFTSGVMGAGYVYSFAVQADGKILAGGTFTNMADQARNCLARLNSDGTLDAGFDPTAGGVGPPFVYGVAMQADGKLLMGGGFSTVSGLSRRSIARFLASEPATSSLTCEGTTLTWLRGGTSPEVWRTTFESSSDGLTWAPVGAGTRISGGWQLTGVTFGSDLIRARGFMTGGQYNGSHGIVESLLGAPKSIADQPVSRTNNAGTTASFAVDGVLGGPLYYQWRKDGINLVDGANVSGATGAVVSLANVLGADAGGYDVIVSNVYGCLASTVATLTVNDPAIVTQPTAQVGNVDGSVTFAASAAGSAPLDFQWYKEGVGVQDATNASLTLTGLQTSDAGAYTVVVSNPYGCATSAVAALTINLAPADPSFNPDANGTVYSLATQPDGKILVGGAFGTLSGEIRSALGRLNADGTLDTGFTNGAGASVYSLVVEDDGHVLVGGNFTNIAGGARSYIARLNADSTLDDGFTNGASGLVYTQARQADGKIVVGGNFTNLAGQARNRIARLNADGSLDAGFTNGANGVVYALHVQSDGKILVGGAFTTLAGQTASYSGRLSADGSLDTTFTNSANSYVYTLAVQPDGKILVGGLFTTLSGQTRNRLGRLNADGTLDTGFTNGANNYVYALALQTDGSILVGGSFTNLAGQARNRLARLNADGSLDPDFDPGASATVYALAAQSDGNILVGGSFTNLAGMARNRLARMHNTAPATQRLTYDGGTVTWERGGTGPEVWRTAFDVTTNGTDWVALGAGTRGAGGWQLTGLTATAGVIRAHGYLSGGYYNSAGGIVENMILAGRPASRNANAGTTVTFGVGGVAGGTLRYQWRKDGTPLEDGGGISGATNTTLTLGSVLGANAGGYDVVVRTDYCSMTSTVAQLTVVDPAINTQPVSQLGMRQGGSALFTADAAGSGTLACQWFKNGVALTSATNSSLAFSNLQPSDQGDYTLVVSGAQGCTTSAVAVLRLALDTGFDPNANGYVLALALQPDGKVLLGGYFATLAGQPCNCLGRLNADGSLDTGFTNGANGGVLSLAVQSDGRILVGGEFTTLAGQPRNYLGRLNADGTLDTDFTNGANSSVYTLVPQANGKVLAGGTFTALAGQTRNRIGQFNADGTLDAGFTNGASGYVYSLALQSDGKILVGGGFDMLAGRSRGYIGRLNADGTLDTGFTNGANNWVYNTAVQPDGRILVSGSFSTLAGQPRGRIGRLNADGSLDTTFTNGANNLVYAVALDANGRALVGGGFTALAGQPRNYIGRLNADGSLDSTFTNGANNYVYGVALDANGRVLAGGAFTTLAGQTRNYIGRFNSTDPATQSLSRAGDTLTWLRGGASPEVWRTTFEHTTNGVVWGALGDGTRISGGWQLTGVAVTGGVIRARGCTAGGFYNGSGGMVESLLGAPLVIATQPAGRTNNAATTAAFIVGGVVGGPLTYQWRKDGTNLASGGNLSGADTDTLTLTGVLRGDEGGYDVVVSTADGSLTSAVARLTVLDPVITVQPTTQYGVVGRDAVFGITATGTPPLYYQWRKNGVPVAGANGATCTVACTRYATAGFFDVIVSNACGSVTSALTELVVVDSRLRVSDTLPATFSTAWSKSGWPGDGSLAKSGGMDLMITTDYGNAGVGFLGIKTGTVVRMSLGTTPQVLTYNAAASSFTNGKAVWQGQTDILTYDTWSNNGPMGPLVQRTRYSRLTMVVTTNGVPVPLLDPSTVGLGSDVVFALPLLKPGTTYVAYFNFQTDTTGGSAFTSVSPSYVHFDSQMTSSANSSSYSFEWAYYYNGPEAQGLVLIFR